MLISSRGSPTRGPGRQSRGRRRSPRGPGQRPGGERRRQRQGRQEANREPHAGGRPNGARASDRCRVDGPRHRSEKRRRTRQNRGEAAGRGLPRPNRTNSRRAHVCGSYMSSLRPSALSNRLLPAPSQLSRVRLKYPPTILSARLISVVRDFPSFVCMLSTVFSTSPLLLQCPSLDPVGPSRGPDGSNIG